MDVVPGQPILCGLNQGVGCAANPLNVALLDLAICSSEETKVLKPCSTLANLKSTSTSSHDSLKRSPIFSTYLKASFQSFASTSTGFFSVNSSPSISSSSSSSSSWSH